MAIRAVRLGVCDHHGHTINGCLRRYRIRRHLLPRRQVGPPVHLSTYGGATGVADINTNRRRAIATWRSDVYGLLVFQRSYSSGDDSLRSYLAWLDS
jgi:hypothetical protein